MFTPAVQRSATTRVAAVAAAREAFSGNVFGRQTGKRAVHGPARRSRERSTSQALPLCFAVTLLLAVAGFIVQTGLSWSSDALAVPANTFLRERQQSSSFAAFQPPSQPGACESQIDPDVPLLFVGGQGGSGTRGVWAVLEASAVTVRSDAVTRDSLASREAGAKSVLVLRRAHAATH